LAGEKIEENEPLCYLEYSIVSNRSVGFGENDTNVVRSMLEALPDGRALRSINDFFSDERISTEHNPVEASKNSLLEQYNQHSPGCLDNFRGLNESKKLKSSR